MSEIEIIQTGAIQSRQDFNQEQIKLIKQQILRPKNREATDAELKMFAECCASTGLDPFRRQIYGVYRTTKINNNFVEHMSIQTSIDGFRLIAQRTGEYQGQTPAQWCGQDGQWVDVWLKNEPPAAARAGVYRQGFIEPLFATAHWAEYAQYDNKGQITKFWGSMPSLMLAKVAEALALRKAFAAEMSGLYTTEEMTQANNVTAPTPAPQQAPQARKTSVRKPPAQVQASKQVDNETGEVLEVETEAVSPMWDENGKMITTDQAPNTATAPRARQTRKPNAASDSQKQFINDLAAKKGFDEQDVIGSLPDADIEIEGDMPTKIDQLTSPQASALIELLKAQPDEK